MQKVVMVNPKWDKGYIEKYLVVPMRCERIVPIHHYDPNILSHVQYAGVGDYIFRIRHFLETNTFEETQVLVTSEQCLIKPTNLTITSEIARYLEALRDSTFKLFSIIKGANMSVYELFDCSIDKRTSFLQPLRLVDPEMFDYVIANLEYSRNIDCEIDWKTAASLPRWLNNRERLVVDVEDKSVLHTSEHWLLFHKDGTVTFPELTPTKGAKIAHESRRTLEVYKAAPVAMPDTVHRAIKITIGANPVGTDMRGVSWNLYQRNKS